MGLKKFVIGSLITTAVSAIVAKVSEDRKDEKKLETETQRAISQEQEETRRRLIEEQSNARHWQQAASLREARERIPISTVCPYCDGNREIDRVAGLIKCPYCDKTEPLPAVHLYDEDLDGKIVKTANTDTLSQNAQLKIDIMGKISFILGIVSVITLGLFIVPEAGGIYFGVKVVTNENESSIAPETIKNAIKGIILSSVSIVIMILFYIITG
ncbi:MAG TPA: hypothetical protein P5191_07190 [Ruminococcus sp.]|nr:hypothetical protein [Ruminococcus sp.]